MNILSKAGPIVATISRHNDITLAMLLVAILGLMIIPLPTVVVDTLLGMNLGISLVILMMSLYVANILEFSVFPTLLLFTTLFRVALNVTTTRLILIDGDAGEIINTFGEFVVSGNFVVGAVIFLIITVVQFLVIAKGSERVAEVGARFSLDAMPGKQMSIDADLRAGVIDMEEAQLRRANVGKESQLYGAMDGAMKFVKGDSIAGMVITVINIVGGVIIGVTQVGLPASEALQKYGILTIGDGLVSQIPSLLISIAAGIIITRTSDDNVEHLGGQIGDQIFNQPKAIYMAGGLLLLIAMIPGFPKTQMFAISGGLVLFGLTLKQIKSLTLNTDTTADLQATLLSSTAQQKSNTKVKLNSDAEFSPTVPLIFDMSPVLGEHLNYEDLNQELIKLRHALYYDLGVPFPGINIRPNANLPAMEYALLLHEIPMTSGRLQVGASIAVDTEDNLSMLGVAVSKQDNFLPEIPSLWVSNDQVTLLEQAGISVLAHAKILSYHLSIILARHANEFVGLQETRYLLDQMESKAPELVRECTRLLATQKIAEIFARLAQEQVSIRNLRAILESLIEWAPKEKDVVMLTEYVRCALKRQISYTYCSGYNILTAYLLDNELEETIRKAIRQTSSGAFLALDPQTQQRFITKLREVIGDSLSRKQKVVLLTSMDIRRYVRRLIEADFYQLPVVSYQELTPEISIQPIARVCL